tara:strand:+ start:3293 stop:4144 length:852 start_codon:yes stop_codon:yes gene_type:complete
MNNYLIYNGNLFNESDELIKSDNRSFRYGDSIFETVRVIEGRICFFNDHFERLTNSAEFLEFHFDLSKEELLAQINILLEKNNINKGGKVRIQVFRNQGGMYVPTSYNTSFFIEAQPLDDNLFNFNPQGLHIDLYSDIKKPINLLSAHKTANALLFVKAGLYKKTKHVDDCIILNDKGNLCEAISSNLFLKIHDSLYTPSVTQGCLPGIMRNQVIKLCRHYGVNLLEGAIHPKMLLEAEEIFFTNAIQGITWVRSFSNKRYFNKTSRYLNEMLNKHLLEAVTR